MPTRKLQNSDDFRGQKFYIGLDVHKKSWAVTVRSWNFVVAHFTQPPSPAALLSRLQRKFPGGDYYSTYEAMRPASAERAPTRISVSLALRISLSIPEIYRELTRRRKTRRMSMTAAHWPFTSKKAIYIRFICYPGNSRSSGPYFVYGNQRQGT